MQFNFRNLKKAAVTIFFWLFLLILGNVITAKAQNHNDRNYSRRNAQYHQRDDRRDQRRHQINRSQVYYGNNGYYNNNYNNGNYNDNYYRNNYNRRPRSNSGGLLRIIFGNGRNHRRH